MSFETNGPAVDGTQLIPGPLSSIHGTLYTDHVPGNARSGPRTNNQLNKGNPGKQTDHILF